ncbi:MAG: class I SAM-dependent methyltransferase [Candidatus Saliniplasma sp.]
MVNLLEDGELDFNRLKELSSRPPLFESGDGEIWTDEHISEYLLRAHLDPERDMASRRNETIKKSCEWIVSRCGLEKGSKVIDLGCGPGLYCSELSRYDVDVTGVDFSERSIEYAREHRDTDIEFIHGNYLKVDIPGKYDSALMIYNDFGVLSEDERDLLLDRVNSLLKDGGYFVFDVLTPSHLEAGEETSYWSIKEYGGFWCPEGYIELFNRFYYPEKQVKLDQYIIITMNGDAEVYRIWHRFFTPSQISTLLKKHGFEVEDFYGDLTGKTIGSETADTMGIVARKDN